jgi:long-chain acyl-CoA synthetase
MESSSPPMSLVELLDISAARYGPRPLFLTRRDGQWVATSYAEFRRIVENLRGGMAGLGVRAGDRVGIIAGNRVEWAAVAYASYQLGAVLVPMYESQRAADWAFIVRDAAVKLLFVSAPSIHEQVADFPRTISTLEKVALFDGGDGAARFADLLAAGARSPVPCARPTPDDVAALMYTSGTTGEPKGVILSHGNIVSNVVALQGIVPVSEGHRTLSFLPWAHAFGHTVELHMLIACGASAALAESIDKIMDNLLEVRPTVLIAVPRIFLRVYSGVTSMLAARPRLIRWLARRGLEAGRARSAGRSLGLPQGVVWRLADRLIFSKVRARVGGRLEFAISGAAALPREVAELVDGLGIQVYEGYGLTETSPVVSANIPGHRKLGSVGRPLPGVQVTIDTATTGDPRQGEIVVRGPNVTRGYYNRREETRAVLAADGSGALRTGDIGYLDDDGYLYVTGRIKEQYKLSNGKYVSPAPIEERLKLSPFVSDLMVYGDNRVCNVALVVPDLAAVRAWAAAQGVGSGDAGALLGDPLLLEEVRGEIERLSAELRGYERIASFVLLPEPFTQENGMLTPSLKLKRRKIIDRWRDEIDRMYQGIADQDGDVSTTTPATPSRAETSSRPMF